MTLRPLTTQADLRRGFLFAEAQVIGVDARRAQREEDQTRRRVTRWLPPNPDGGLVAAYAVGAFVEDALVGTGVIHPLYQEALELHEQGASDDYLKQLLKSRRTLTCLAVLDTYRRAGIGRRIVQILADRALAEQARWVTGFMDERNGSPDFYRHVGFTIQQKNQPNPPLPPTFLREFHPRGVDGWWFARALVALRS